MTPPESLNRIDEIISEQYPLGEFKVPKALDLSIKKL